MGKMPIGHPTKNWAQIRRINQARQRRNANPRPGQSRDRPPRNPITGNQNRGRRSGIQQARENYRQELQRRQDHGGRDITNQPQNILSSGRAERAVNEGASTSGIISGLGHAVQRGQGLITQAQEHYNQAREAVASVLGPAAVASLERTVSSHGKRFLNKQLQRIVGGASEEPQEGEVADSTETEEPPAQRARIEESREPEFENFDMNNDEVRNEEAGDGEDVAMDDATLRSASSGGGGASSGGMGVRGSVQKPTGTVPRMMALTQTYTKQYKLRINTAKIDYVYQTTATLNTSPTNFYYRLPYHDLPVEYYGLYLTRQEMQQLALFGRVNCENISVKAYMSTAIIPFETGGTTAAIGNNNVGVQAVCFQNLRPKRWGEIPNGKDYIEKIFWGNHATTLDKTNALSTNLSPNPPAWFTTRTFDRRFQYFIQPDFAFTTNGGTGGNVKPLSDAIYYPTYFPWMNYVKKRWNASISEGYFDEYHYTPKNKYMFGQNMINQFTMGPEQASTEQAGRGLLDTQHHVTEFTPFSLITTGTPTNDAPIIDQITITNRGQTSYTGITAPVYGNSNRTIRVGGSQNRPAMNTDIGSYASMKIDSDIFFNEMGNLKYSTNTPSMTFGLEPLIANIGTNTNIDAYVEIIIDTSITVHISQNPDYLYLGGGAPADNPLTAPLFKNAEFEISKGMEFRPSGEGSTTDDTGRMFFYTTGFKDTEGYDQDLSQYSKRLYDETLKSSISTQYTATDTPFYPTEGPTRRSSRIADKIQKNNPEKININKEKIELLKKDLFNKKN